MDLHDKKTEGKTQKREAAKAEPAIYLGPPIKDTVMPGTVFTNGLTPKIEQIKKDFPVIGELFVPLSRAAEMRKQLRTKGSAMQRFYEEAERRR